MNKHLAPVFEILLPGLEKSGIYYWVHGGVSVAAFKGRFIRENNDVDIFIKEEDYQKAKTTLKELCDKQHFRPPKEAKRNSWRQKLEVTIEGEKILSVVTVKLNDTIVSHMFGKISIDYPPQILNMIERNIDGFRFFTTTDKYIQIMFKDYLSKRQGRSKNPETIKKIRDDAKKLLTQADFMQFIENNPLWN